MPSIAALQHAPWSLSKIQCALRCPLEFHFRYVDRLHEPEVAPETRLGKALHGALEAVLTHVPVAEALAGARCNLLSDDERTALVKALAAEAGDLLLLVAGERRMANHVLGILRLELGRPPVSEGGLRYL